MGHVRTPRHRRTISLPSSRWKITGTPGLRRSGGHTGVSGRGNGLRPLLSCGAGVSGRSATRAKAARIIPGHIDNDRADSGVPSRFIASQLARMELPRGNALPTPYKRPQDTMHARPICFGNKMEAADTIKFGQCPKNVPPDMSLQIQCRYSVLAGQKCGVVVVSSIQGRIG